MKFRNIETVLEVIQAEIDKLPMNRLTKEVREFFARVRDLIGEGQVSARLSGTIQEELATILALGQDTFPDLTELHKHTPMMVATYINGVIIKP